MVMRLVVFSLHEPQLERSRLSARRRCGQRGYRHAVRELQLLIAGHGTAAVEVFLRSQLAAKTDLID